MHTHLSAPAPVLSARSLPAKSTSDSLPKLVFLVALSYDSICMQKMECERLLSAFILVAPVCRSVLPMSQ